MFIYLYVVIGVTDSLGLKSNIFLDSHISQISIKMIRENAGIYQMIFKMNNNKA